MKVLVTGGRAYNNAKVVADVLDVLKAQGIELLIEGGAKGVDTLAREWARKNSVKCKTVRADWDGEGKAAGVYRNVRMLGLSPDIVVAFPGGKGTAHMVKIAKMVKVTVMEISE